MSEGRVCIENDFVECGFLEKQCKTIIPAVKNSSWFAALFDTWLDTLQYDLDVFSIRKRCSGIGLLVFYR